MKLLYSLARSLGYELIRRKKNPSLRAHLRNVIHRHAIDVVIDVGANDGQFALLLRSEGFRGTIYSFEPVNSTYEQLRRIAQHDANWEVFNTAQGCARALLIRTQSISMTDRSSFLLTG